MDVLFRSRLSRWCLGDVRNVIYGLAIFLTLAAAVPAESATLLDSTGTSPTFIDASAEAIAKQDCDLWIVSTRNNCGCEFKPSVRRYECGRGWQTKTIDDFYAADDKDVATVVFVHGNDNTPREAVSQGMQFFCNMCRPACTQQRIRFVIWSWPSSYTFTCYRKDLRIKAARIDPQACYLGQFLARLHVDVPLSMIGYSYGAPIVMGALQLRAGGSLCGKSLNTICGPGYDISQKLQPCRVVLLAAAMRNDSLMPGRKYGQAMDLIEHLSIDVNCRDRMLRFYPWLNGGGGPPALGYTGAVGMNQMGATRERITHVNVHPYLGRHHKLKKYLAAGPVMTRCWMDVVKAWLPNERESARSMVAMMPESITMPVRQMSAWLGTVTGWLEADTQLEADATVATATTETKLAGEPRRAPSYSPVRFRRVRTSGRR